MAIIPKFAIRFASKCWNFVLKLSSSHKNFGRKIAEVCRKSAMNLSHISSVVFSLARLLVNLILRKLTIKQVLLDLRFRLVSRKSIQNDDFNWEIYPAYYREELKSISRIHTLNITGGNFKLEAAGLTKKDPKAKDLHPSHELLYEIIGLIKPLSVLEVGCGGGDHLANIHELCPRIKLYGMDRSHKQLSTMLERHPKLPVETWMIDAANASKISYSAQLVYTHAVLMHISENEGRFRRAINFVFSSAKEIVVLVENWSQHNFLTEINRIRSENSMWGNSFIYVAESKHDDLVSALVISKKIIPNFQILISYEQVLAGRKIQVH